MEENVAARNALENLYFTLKQKIGTGHDEIIDKVSESERDPVLKQVEETLEWLDVKPLVDADRYEHKQNDLKQTADRSC